MAGAAQRVLRGGAAAQRWLGLETAAAGWRWAAGVTYGLRELAQKKEGIGVVLTEGLDRM